MTINENKTKFLKTINNTNHKLISATHVSKDITDVSMLGNVQPRAEVLARWKNAMHFVHPGSTGKQNSPVHKLNLAHCSKLTSSSSFVFHFNNKIVSEL